MIGWRIEFPDISRIAFLYFQDQIATHSLAQLVATSQMVCHMVS